MSLKPREIPDADGEEIHVTWESPVFDLSGYAASSRSALLGLLEAKVRLRLIPFHSGARETDADPNSG